METYIHTQLQYTIQHQKITVAVVAAAPTTTAPTAAIAATETAKAGNGTVSSRRQTFFPVGRGKFHFAEAHWKSSGKPPHQSSSHSPRFCHPSPALYRYMTNR